MKCPHSKSVFNPTFLKLYPQFAVPYKNTRGSTSYKCKFDTKLKLERELINIYGTRYEDKLEVSPYLVVPCGKCMICKSNLKQDWIFRLKKELDNSIGAVFVTLTYDDLHLPYTDGTTIYRLADCVIHNNDEARPTLVKKDFQDFVMRLRKNLTTKFGVKDEQGKLVRFPLRFFAVGEYGGKGHRPHYHGIFFGVPHYDTEAARTMRDYDPYRIFFDNWQNGQVDIGTVTGNSLSYVISYLDFDKKAPWENSEPQFALMSRRPGIGSSFIDKKSIKSYYDLSRLCTQTALVNNDGVLMPLPRYYKSKLYSDDDRLEAQKVGHSVQPVKTEHDYYLENEKRKLSLVAEKRLQERALKRKKHSK